MEHNELGQDARRRGAADGPPTGPDIGRDEVMRGGSYLCHGSCRNRYRVAARTADTPDGSSGDAGFRSARDVAPSA
ncbi:SUMF1/EgtB/PvdO family nonheme iron enzyme [Embleya sp. NPDC005575]|uniref:SUMF1/EgtB/PvdO family nonheme iron enzyme n=1 Tax=Embleya sp. NPDC005575 TaxID=3156892 RepID=UPI00339F0FB2